MEKCRVLKKSKEVVPGTPSTQRKILHSLIVQERKEPSTCSIDKMIVTNIKEMLCYLKRRKSDEARAALNILTSSVSGENLTETKSKGKTAKSLGLRRNRVSGGCLERNVYFRSEKACFTATTRKVKSDKINESTKHPIYE